MAGGDPCTHLIADGGELYMVVRGAMLGGRFLRGRAVLCMSSASVVNPPYTVAVPSVDGTSPLVDLLVINT